MIATTRPQSKKEPEADRPASDMLDRLNRVEVSEDMLADAAKSIADLADGARNDFDQRMITLIEVLKRNHPTAKIPLTALAIDFRLRALVRLLEATFVHGCEIDVETRRPRVSSAALRAACREPLVRNSSGLASFDVTSFKQRLLH